MAGETLKLVVEVAADKAEGVLKSITATANQAGIAMKTSLMQVGPAANQAMHGTKGLEDRLKGLKGELASGDRTINFFARSLNNIVPEASAAGQGLRLLVDGLIGGLGVGFAIQATMSVLQLFGDSLKETERAAKESAKEAKDAAEAWYQVGAQFDAAMAKIGAPKKSWQREQVDSATAETDKQIEAAEKKLREVNADLNQALNDRDKVGLIDNGADERVVAALAEKRAVGETLAALRQTREEQRAAASEKAEQAAAVQTDASTASTFYAEETKVRERARAAAKIVADAYTQATRDLLDAGYIAAERIAEKLRVVIDPLVQKAGLFGITDKNRLGPTAFTQVGFGGGDAVGSVGQSAVTAEAAKVLGAIDKENAKAAEQTKKLTEQIATTWIDGMTAMLGETKITAAGMLKLFAQLAAQMMAQATGSAIFGPLGGLAGALIGKALPSAAGGWDRVPSDTLAQIHKDEMVLSAGVANVVRRAAEGGGGGASAPPQVNIYAWDTLSFKEYIIRNGTDFNAATRELARQGR
jgi:hypothetical protein